MPSKQQFLADIQSADAKVRFAAWRSAHEQDAAVIADLVPLAAGANPGVAKAAREAIAGLVHSVGKQESEKRGQVVGELLKAAGESAPAAVRVFALRQLSLIAQPADAPAIAQYLKDPALAEEAIYCLERIPGPAVDKLLAAHYRMAPDAFKPRILAALGHRRAAAGVDVALAAMRSPNSEIAVAGAKAFARIGRKTAQPLRWPDAAKLSAFEQMELMDSKLRYADARREAGDHTEAMRLYRAALAAPEEHFQCAALVGIAKMRTAEAAAAIFPFLNSGNPKVRLTAQNLWKTLAGG